LRAFSQTRIPVRWPSAAPNLEPRDYIWPTDPAPVIRRLEDGTNEFTELHHRVGRKVRRSSVSARSGDASRSAAV
jgi:hypothetical protein